MMRFAQNAAKLPNGKIVPNVADFSFGTLTKKNASNARTTADIIFARSVVRIRTYNG